jgi:glutaminyl-tRNA synthetase
MKIIKTRFPPEPNGFMHLGHAKSAYHNFNFTDEYGVKTDCHIRFDDTNPKEEKKLYVDSIISDIKWLGYKPSSITFTSDYFTNIIDLTQTLIIEGNAYCDPSTSEEITEQRKTKTESKYRDRSIIENIEIFTNMLNGLYKEGEMTLRLKIPIEDRTNDCMIDPIAYRIIETPHFRTGTKFKIYPTYEYSHYIVDSIEGITHSFCTLEFYVRRNLSYWILNKLKLKCPIIEETNRLETNFGLLSKRKIKFMIESNTLEGWDDPRLLTIAGLRNKGISPKMINDFCAKQTYTKNMNSIVHKHLFDSIIRYELSESAPRRMAVFNPLRVNLVNHTEYRYFYKPLYPSIENSPKALTCIAPVIYIEADDFMKTANQKYKRMTMEKCVRLKYTGIIKYLSHTEDDNGNIIELNVVFIPESENTEKVNGTIHWVSYRHLPIKFKLIDWQYPIDNEIEADYAGKKIEKTIYIDEINTVDNYTYWQFERQCYATVDMNTLTGNYLVGLKENKTSKDLKNN